MDVSTAKASAATGTTEREIVLTRVFFPSPADAIMSSKSIGPSKGEPNP
jgi:hypothetical protein